jgi:PAS domain S-box-containing protein
VTAIKTPESNGGNAAAGTFVTAASFCDRAAPPSRRPGSVVQDLQRDRPRSDALERVERLVKTGSWEWDVESDVLLWSDNMFRLLGLEPGAIVPTPDSVVERTHPEDRQRVAEEMMAARECGIHPDIVYRAIWPDGTVRVLHSTSASVAEDGNGNQSRLVGSVQDVTELVAAERESAESLTLMETLQSTAPVSFGFVDREFRIVRVNERMLETIGCDREDAIGRTIAELVPDIWAQVGSVYREVLATGEPRVNVEIERAKSNSQERRCLLANYYPVRVEQELIGVGAVVIDITEREQAEHFRSAVMDTMVEGLYVLDGEGRVTFVNAAASKMLGWTGAELSGRSMHDSIHFQHADGSPHAEADCELLKVRTEGRSVRMEREHFTRKNGTLFPVAYSAAPLMAGPKVNGVVVVFRDARLEHAEEDKAQRELDALVWVGRVRDALDEGRLLLYSQPILPLGGGEPREELLLRMAGTNGEIYSPGAFLPVAEKYGLIGEIDRWVIVEAIRLAAAGRRVEANLSAESIGKLDLLALIERELRDTGADPANVVFEITETALMENVEAGEAFARGLGEIGCQVALDDFGTGFGGFTYLKKLPIKYLKIDIDFVRELRTNRANQHLVRAIIGLAKDFGYETIAEGVEDAETLALLARYGVDFAQGFHLGRPSMLVPAG